MTATMRQMYSVTQYLELPGYEPITLPLADQVNSTVVVIPIVNRYQMYFISLSVAGEAVPADAGQPMFEQVHIVRRRWQMLDGESGRAWWEWRWDTDEAEQKFILDGRVRQKYR